MDGVSVLNKDQQLQLLLNAIGNVIDNNPNVEHITFPEIWEWLNDIIGSE
jgi:hypothetical protein